MPFRGPTPAELDGIVEQLLPLIDNDPHNPLAQPLGMTFAQIEQTASRLGQRLVARLTEHTLDRHSQAAHPDTTAKTACPKCAILCRLTRKKRRLTTAAGEIEYSEPASHCVDCRRDFFPSA